MKSEKCRQHAQTITNFCQHCESYLCPQCVEQHSERNLKHKIYSVRSALAKAEQKLAHIKQSLLRGTAPKSEFELSIDRVLDGLRDIREQCHALVDSFIGQEVEKLTKLAQTAAREPPYEGVQNIIEEIEGLSQQLTQPASSAGALAKTFKLDQESLLSHVLGRPKMNNKTVLLTTPAGLKPFERGLAETYRIEVEDVVLASSAVSISVPTKMVPEKPRGLKFEKAIQEDRPASLYYYDDLSQSLKVYDASSKVWSVAEIDESEAKVPEFSKVVALGKNRFLFTGGKQGAEAKSNEVLLLEGGRLTRVGKLLERRSSHCVLYFRGKVYVLGGYKQKNVVTNSCEAVDPSKGFVTSNLPAMLVGAANCYAVGLADGQILKAGGLGEGSQNCNTIQIYTPERKLWTTVDPTVQLGEDFTLLSSSGIARLSASEFFVFGGINEERGKGQLSKQCFFLRKENEEWVIENERGVELPQPSKALCQATSLQGATLALMHEEGRKVRVLGFDGNSFSRLD